MHSSRIASDKGIDTGDLDSGWDSARPFMRLIRARAGAARRKLRDRNPIGLCVDERIHSPSLSLSLFLSWKLLVEFSSYLLVLSFSNATSMITCLRLRNIAAECRREKQFPASYKAENRLLHASN